MKFTLLNKWSRQHAMFEFDQGIRISETSFWLDANKKVPLSFVSHAHSDHVKRHGQIIATPQTISLISLQNKNVNARPLNFHQRDTVDDVTIELFPAGHILGSAQILVVRDNMRLIYTGDFKTEKNSTTEPFEIKPADILIMESTFGAPRYKFPPRWLIVEKIVNFIEYCFQMGFIPILLGYRIGKAQEILKILGDLNYQISLHATIEPVVKIYESYGVKFKNYQVYQGEDLRNRVLLVPPHLARGQLVKKIWNAKKLVLTGWAAYPNAKYRYGADEAICFSDHADFEQLINYVHQVNPQKVFITHGFESFVYDLRREGFKAELLKPSPQIPLF